MADPFLAALAPGELDALSRARQAQQQVNKALRLARSDAAALAERQFNRVDPDNRLVAAELERRWEAALSELRAAEEAFAQQASTEPTKRTGLGKDLNNKVVALFDSLPQIWANHTTTDAHRKALLRCLIERSCLIKVSATLLWRGSCGEAPPNWPRSQNEGEFRRQAHARRRNASASAGARSDGMPDDEITETLTREGKRPCRLWCNASASAPALKRRRSAPDGRTNRLCSALYNWPPGGPCLSQPRHQWPRSENHSASPGGHQHINSIAVLVQETMALDPFAPAVLRSAIAGLSGILCGGP
ncbi:hypothetical protein [Sinorhizobium meliloti]|nr:hypothetical protein U8C30_07110 [Sinorhizobium meliloti]